MKSSAAYPHGYAVRLLEMHRPFMALASVDLFRSVSAIPASCDILHCNPTPHLRPRAF